MAAGLYFLKLELNYLDDSSFNTSLNDSQKWRYIQLYLLAKKLNADGSFIRHGHQLSDQDIAWSLHLELKQLQEDIEALKSAGLLSMNGHGPYLTNFKAEQDTPHSGAQRIAEFRERETEKKHDRNRMLQGCYTESESDIESESESEDESVSQSVSEPEPKKTDADDILQSDLKADLCSLAGIPPKYSRRIIASDQITHLDILAELARNYSRQGTGKGKVQNPGIITGINLSAGEVERAAAEWYNQETWGNLPDSIKQKFGITVMRIADGGNNQHIVATRNLLRGDKVTKNVEAFLGRKIEE
jgi:hypothetical protein